MARYTHARNNFLLGEVSPRVLGRTDLEQYNQMCESVINFTPMPMGGVRRRTGTSYVATVNAGHTSNNIKVIPYKYDSQNHFIVISSARIDLYKTDGTFVDDISIAYDFDATNVSYSQYGNILVVCDGINFPLIIYYTGSIITYQMWGLGVISRADTGSVAAAYPTDASCLPWLNENTDTSIQMRVSASTGSGLTMTASNAYFTTAMEGTFFRIRVGTACALVYMTNWVSTTQATVNVISTTAVPAAAVGANDVTEWSECAWGRFGGPRAVTFYQGRIFFAGSGFFPDRVWASQTEDMFELSPPDPTASVSVGADGSFDVDLNLGERSLISFLSPGQSLFVGSTEREAILEELNKDYGLGVLNTRCVPQTTCGATFAMPQRMFNVCTFIDKSLQKLTEVTFNADENAYKPLNLNKLADHLFAPGGITTTQSLKEIAWSKDQNIMWAITTKRDLFSVTRDPDTGAIGWARHYLGGTGATGSPFDLDTTYPSIISICVVEDADYGFDEVFMVVARRVNGSDVRYIEKMTYVSSDYFDIEDMNDDHLDCSIDGYDAVAKTSWVALAAHLGSETVHVMADGIYIGTKTLSAGGNLTLDTAANYVAVGYNYNSTLIPVALQSNSLFGSGLGQIKRTEEVTVLFDRTVSCSFGVESNSSDLDEINFREDSVAAEDPTPLFSGEKTMKLEASYEGQQKLMFKVTEPLPCTILAVIAKGVLYD